MRITLAVDDNVMRLARLRAEALGTSVNQLVCEYLEQLAGRPTATVDVAEFRRLSNLNVGHSHGWKFNREELHER